MNDQAINGLSIVVPVLNEEENIEVLVKRIDAILRNSTYPYEIVFVDDHSSNATVAVLQELATVYPITILTNTKAAGAAQSFFLGFAQARYNHICLLQVEYVNFVHALPNLIRKVERGRADIVIANRTHTQSIFIYEIVNRFIQIIFRNYFESAYRGVDLQSGFKLLRKEVIERLNLIPSTQALHTELIIKARNAGYRIDKVHIVPRSENASRSSASVSGFFSSLITAVWLRIRGLKTVTFSSLMIKKKGNGFHHRGAEYVPHTDLDSVDTAFYRLSLWQGVVLSTILIGLGVAVWLNWHGTLKLVIALLTVLYFSDLLFNFFLIYRSFNRSPEIKIPKATLRGIPDNDWPSYTILCPLYREAQVLPQFVAAMKKLDYPKDKLQILLLLEEDDHETIKIVQKYHLPSCFEVVVVPHSSPKTKPKACNYGLSRAAGEYIVIYDAEDVPDRTQLKKAVLAFRKATPKTICVQAKLNFYNPRQNILTRVFTAEYSLWFDLILTGLQSIQAPIPLGGTSNHFRTAFLKNLRGWDAFNVTEDCDLGVRLVKLGFRTAVFDSMTLEEANSDLRNWFRQRTRWIKGYMQTYLVHMRSPRLLLRHWRRLHLLTFQLVVGGKILSMFINPVMWFLTIAYFAFLPTFGSFLRSFFPPPVLYMGLFSLIFGNFLYLYYYMMGCYKRKYDDLIKYVFLVPLYWLAMSLAAVFACFELIRQPHYWAKTTHGLHLTDDKVLQKRTGVIA